MVVLSSTRAGSSWGTSWGSSASKRLQWDRKGPGPQGGIRHVTLGTGQTWVLQASDGCWPCQHYPNSPCPLPYASLIQYVDSKKDFILLNYLYLFLPYFLKTLHPRVSAQRIILNLWAPSAVSFISPLEFTFSITALLNPCPSLLSM